MYESFFGLKEKPFNLLPDPDYLYMSSGHENIFTHLEYAIAENKGFVVITGEVGSGKTTLINYLISKSLMGVEVGLINNTYIAPNQVIKSICREFELDSDGLDRDEMLDRFVLFDTPQVKHGRPLILAHRRIVRIKLTIYATVNNGNICPGHSPGCNVGSGWFRNHIEVTPAVNRHQRPFHEIDVGTKYEIDFLKDGGGK